jgi:flagellar transcriptional activator FlhC
MCVSNFNQRFTTIAGLNSNESIPVDIEVVNQAQKILEAVQLVRLGARAPLVCQLTGLTKKVVSRLYPLLTGIPSPSGQVPFTDTWYLKSNQRLLQANVVWRLFQHLEQSGRSTANVLIHVYQTYLQITTTPSLSITRAFFVLRLLTMNAWYQQTCGYCSMLYVGPPGNSESICPACTGYFNYHCRSCSTTIEYHPAGRRKMVCSGCYEKQKRSQKRLTYGSANGYSGF